MTDTNNLPEDNLQFEKAEFDQAETKKIECAECRDTIINTYFDAGGKTVCLACRDKIEEEQSRGNGVTRFIRALLFGVPAAFLGAGIYYAISALTGYEFGLVAIVIGLMVGAAVRAGSRRKGGWAYQTLAVILTYLAIVSTYIPLIIQEARKTDQAGNTEIILPLDTARVQENNTAVSSEISEEQTSMQDIEFTAGTVPSGSSEPEEVSFLMGLIGLGVLLVFAMIVPFMMGFENILGLVIIAIGLYEAWKINKRNPIAITGPFTISS